MKLLPKGVTIIISFVLFFILFPTLIRAQCPDAGFDPGCDPQTCLRDDGSYCPIDSGVYFLLAIGAIYGIKKVRDAKLVREVK